jgi:hypothetical protein
LSLCYKKRHFFFFPHFFKGQKIMENTQLSLYEELVAAGFPLSNHFSDLYFPDTPQTRAILDRHPVQKTNATNFVNQAPLNKGQLWIDVPFAFDPWWNRLR